MITVVTPFKRIENLELLSKVLKGKCNWILLTDDKELEHVLPEYDVMYCGEIPEFVCPGNYLFNTFIDEGLDDETQYMILCDDDSVENGFFDKIPNEDVVITSMKRGQRIPLNGCGYGHGDLIASPNNIGIGSVAGEQCIVKGKVLKNYRYGLSAIGDGEMIMEIVKNEKVTYVPDAYVLFNYFEDGRYDSFSRKPIVLFVGDFYCAGVRDMGISEWETNIWKSLESTGIANVARFHMDKYYYHTGNKGDATLLERIDAVKPDYVVLVIYKQFGTDPTTIDKETIEVMSKKTKIISIWGDLEAEEVLAMCKEVEPFMWKVVGTASKEIVEANGYTYMHVPKDPRVFNNPNKERDIDVVFSGSYNHGRAERREAMEYLLNNGVNLVFGGSEGGDHFTTEEYADRYKRAKIALSFSQARGKNVVNARPFEAMSCGAMLLEQKSPELEKLYKDGHEYISWTTKEDLLSKVEYYLGRGKYRNKIADEGYQRTLRDYSAKTFWEKVLK